MSESYRDLLAWQRAVALVTEIYACTESFPKREIYGLANQIRRASVSVSSNIAEGKGRHSRREYLQFLYRSRGSLFEVETQLQIALNLNFLNSEQHHSLSERASEVARLLSGLISAIERRVDLPDTRHLTPDT